MNFLKSILWVPIVFGIIMSGLATARVVVDGLGIELVTAPATIIAAYENLANSAFHYIVEWPFGLSVPSWIRDTAVIWFIFAGSNSRFLIYRFGAKAGRLTPKFRFMRLKQWLSMPVQFLIILLGPIGTLCLFIVGLLLARAGAKENRNAGRWPDEIWRDGVAAERRFAAVLFAILAINPAIAAGLLWWNAAEIERLTAGIG